MAIEGTNEKTPYGVCFTPTLTGCPPAVTRIAFSIYHNHDHVKNKSRVSMLPIAVLGATSVFYLAGQAGKSLSEAPGLGEFFLA